MKSACGIEAVYMCFNETGIWGGETICLNFLVLIFNVTTLIFHMTYNTMFCDHNFRLICRSNLKFQHNYRNINTNDSQH